MIKVNRIILLGSIFCFSIFTIGNADTLEKELNEVNKLRNSEKTIFEQAEKMCNELLEKYTEPEEQARIYYQLAVIYSQNEQRIPDKIIEFSKKALELPLDPIERLKLYVWWGDAIHIAHRDARNQERVVARRKAVIPYLDGLKENLSLQYPKYTQPENLPEEQNVKADPHGSFLLRRKAEQRKALYEWKKDKFERDVNRLKKTFISQISGTYSDLPWASDEIRELSTKILEDKTVVDDLMSAVGEAMEKRLEELGWAPESPDNSPSKGSASYKQRWYQKTYLATKERLKQTDIPQTVHGAIGSRQLFESINELPAVHAKTRGKGYVSSSMIIDGAYSLGQLEPATYEIILDETSETPAIWVHIVEIRKDQPSLPINLEFGTASASVHIYDEHGNPIDSNDVQLLIGGTAGDIHMDIHMYKRATGVKQGLWQVDHLYKGQYFARAVWDGNRVGGLFDLVDGRNEIELSLEKQNAEVASRPHSEHRYEHNKKPGTVTNGTAVHFSPSTRRLSYET